MNNCLSREILLEYLNNTLSLHERANIKSHLTDCKICKAVLEDLIGRTNIINSALDLIETEQNVHIPEFIPINNNDGNIARQAVSKKLKIRSIVIRAAAIFLILLVASSLFVRKIRMDRGAEYEYYQYIPDINEAYQNNDVSITIYDENGAPVEHIVVS